MRLRTLAYAALALAGASLLGGALYLHLSPQFGGKHGGDRLARYARSPQWRDGIFVNQVPTALIGFKDPGKLLPMLRDFFFLEVPDKEPSSPLPSLPIDPASLGRRDTALERVTWFGHSSLLLEIEGRKVLFDPHFGGEAAPLPFSPRRFPATPVLRAEDLPDIDAVVISHDHFDHLDYATIRAIAPRVGRFFVPLGVGAHLSRWGIAPERVSELDWGDSAAHAGFTFVCAPARHFSGRGLADQFKTLWASWVIKTGRRRIYNSGDSGYGPHFKQIGAAHGPFDLAFIECGQYDPRWAAIHMMADEAVRAAGELGAGLMLPIHWGAFALAMHSWYDPVEKVAAEARKAGLAVTTPRLGEPVDIGGPAWPSDPWWKEVP